MNVFALIEINERRKIHIMKANIEDIAARFFKCQTLSWPRQFGRLENAKKLANKRRYDGKEYSAFK